jgi:hypothetical protein
MADVLKASEIVPWLKLEKDRKTLTGSPLLYVIYLCYLCYNEIPAPYLLKIEEFMSLQNYVSNIICIIKTNQYQKASIISQFQTYQLI